MASCEYYDAVDISGATTRFREYGDEKSFENIGKTKPNSLSLYSILIHVSQQRSLWPQGFFVKTTNQTFGATALSETRTKIQMDITTKINLLN